MTIGDECPGPVFSCPGTTSRKGHLALKSEDDRAPSSMKMLFTKWTLSKVVADFSRASVCHSLVESITRECLLGLFDCILLNLLAGEIGPPWPLRQLFDLLRSTLLTLNVDVYTVHLFILRDKDHANSQSLSHEQTCDHV